eukprot:604166-Prymnesium_polylepis.1
MERRRVTAPARAEEGGEGTDGAKGADGEEANADEPVAAQGSKLNPNAAAFVPAAAAAEGAKDEGGKEGKEGAKEEGAEGAKPAAKPKAAEGEGEGDDDDDDDDDDGEATKPVEEEAGGEEVEVTKWAEKGVGQVRLLVPKSGRGEEGACPRLVMRVEH